LNQSNNSVSGDIGLRFTTSDISPSPCLPTEDLHATPCDSSPVVLADRRYPTVEQARTHRLAQSRQRPRLTCGDAEDGGMQWWRTFTPLRWGAVV
jgi:hypothetical protein